MAHLKSIFSHLRLDSKTLSLTRVTAVLLSMDPYRFVTSRLPIVIWLVDLVSPLLILSFSFSMLKRNSSVLMHSSVGSDLISASNWLFVKSVILWLNVVVNDNVYFHKQVVKSHCLREDK